LPEHLLLFYRKAYIIVHQRKQVADVKTYTQENTMFNQTIDAIQSGKKTIVNTFVTDKEIQSKLVTLIEAQTKFYQGWVDTTLTLAQTLVANAKDSVYKGAK
jgi:hypothetical protein